jgi:hypothetical protein
MPNRWSLDLLSETSNLREQFFRLSGQVRRTSRVPAVRHANNAVATVNASRVCNHGGRGRPFAVSH